MKNLFAVILGLVLFVACEGTVWDMYELGADWAVPDSLKAKQAEWIKETVRAASERMTGGDYEDPEDVIDQAEKTSLRIFGVWTEGLKRRECRECYYKFIPLWALSADEKKIYEHLKETP